jgi:hypothetical protein
MADQAVMRGIFLFMTSDTETHIYPVDDGDPVHFGDITVTFAAVESALNVALMTEIHKF